MCRILMANRTDRTLHIRTLWAAAVTALFPLLLFGRGDSLRTDTASFVPPADTSAAIDLTVVADTVEARLFVYDSSSFEPRRMPAEDLNGYRDESEFDYARNLPPATSFLERIIQGLGKLLSPVLGNETGRFIFQYGIFGAALVLVIVLLMRTEFRGVFKRTLGKKKGEIAFEELEEDIGALDFDALIAEAIAAGNLRRAVRLHYLHLLREMTERGLIEWRREKTNSDYLYELNRSDLHSGFAELTRVFDYVWYGDARLDMERYRRISTGFGSFIRTVRGGA